MQWLSVLLSGGCFQMLFVMLGISIVVFLIFFATPGADPSSRIAGRNAAPRDPCWLCVTTSGSISRCPFNTT